MLSNAMNWKICCSLDVPQMRSKNLSIADPHAARTLSVLNLCEEET